MMLNHSAAYALRAMLYLANSGDGTTHPAATVASALGVPPEYMSKVMHVLVRARLLKSNRGPNGGYTLAVPAHELTLDRIVAAFQELAPSGHCLLGDRACNPELPCSAHVRWSRMSDSVAAFFRDTSLADMLSPFSADETLHACAVGAQATPIIPEVL